MIKYAIIQYHNVIQIYIYIIHNVYIIYTVYMILYIYNIYIFIFDLYIYMCVIYIYIHILYIYYIYCTYTHTYLCMSTALGCRMSHLQAYPWASPWLLQDTSAQWLVLSPVKQPVALGKQPYIYIYWLVVSNMFYCPWHLWDNPSHWLIFFKMVKTTNQYIYTHVFISYVLICLFVDVHSGWWIDLVWFCMILSRILTGRQKKKAWFSLLNHQ